MRKALVIVIVIAIAVSASLIGLGLAMAGPGACATALLQGTLAERDGTLGVAPVPADPSGRVVRVAWPFGYGVGRDEDGTLTLTRVFQVVAREGDPVSVGGGTFGTDPAIDDGEGPDWAACGPVVVGLTAPPEAPLVARGATLRISATAGQACLPPPSGCGYSATIESTDAGTDTAAFAADRPWNSAGTGSPWPLTLGSGLPERLSPGIYRIAFLITEFEDVASPGFTPRPSEACDERVDVSDDTSDVHVSVTFDGSLCVIEVEYTIAERVDAEAALVRASAERALRVAASELVAPADVLAASPTRERADAWLADIRGRLEPWYTGDALAEHLRGAANVVGGAVDGDRQLAAVASVAWVELAEPVVDGPSATVNPATVRITTRYRTASGEFVDVASVRMCTLTLVRGEDGTWRITDEACNESSG